MLLELHVRNLALIEKADVEFGDGLNILTGETGAGKSIIIGSVTMALGGKASRESIRHGADHAYVELVFSVSGEDKIKALSCLLYTSWWRSIPPFYSGDLTRCFTMSVSRTCPCCLQWTGQGLWAAMGRHIRGFLIILILPASRT